VGYAYVRGVSACLLGVACRYDGCALPESSCLPTGDGCDYLPFCPEQLGGISTPRPPAQIVGGDGEDVLDGRARLEDETGRDVTAAFVRGAREAVDLCRRLGITEVLLKARSPSCGYGQIYRGSELVEGMGVTAALMRRHGIRVTSSMD